jgi:CheY-like chemotaxis protein
MNAPVNTARRVAIVEDHGALRMFLRDVLSQLGWTVTGVAGTAETGYLSPSLG